MAMFGSTANVRKQKRRVIENRWRGIRVTATIIQFTLLVATSLSVRAVVRWRWIQYVLGWLCRLALQTGGGGFIKVGQLLATRVDLFDPGFAHPLATLHDKVASRLATRSLAELPEQVARDISTRYFFLEERSSLGGSVAQIFVARDRQNGKLVAIKIVRSDTRAQTFYDIIVFRKLARQASKLWLFRRVPIVQAINSICRQIIFQFNLIREARIQVRLYSWLSEDGVRVPKVESVVYKGAMIMEWLPDLRKIDLVSPEECRKKLALAALRVLFKMIFVDGWIHCDLHPGNIMTDARGRLVILDFGLAAKLGDSERGLLAKFFLAISSDDAVLGVEVILDAAQNIGTSANVQHLEYEISTLFAEKSRKAAGDFGLTDFVRKLFIIQARHEITSTTAFVLPIVALVSFEGQLKAWYPEVDFQREAMPYVLEALATTNRQS